MYAIIQFPNLDTAFPFYMKGKELFSTRCSCINKSDKNPTVAFMLYLDDISPDGYRLFKATLPSQARVAEVEV